MRKQHLDQRELTLPGTVRQAKLTLRVWTSEKMCDATHRSVAECIATKFRNDSDIQRLWGDYLAIAQYCDLVSLGDSRDRSVERLLHKSILAAYRRAIRIDPHNGHAWEGITAQLDILGKYPSAAKAAQQAVENGRVSAGYAIMARVYAQMGFHAKSREICHMRVLRRSQSCFVQDTRNEVLAGEWDLADSNE